jgi:hypothetical protein
VLDEVPVVVADTLICRKIMQITHDTILTYIIFLFLLIKAILNVSKIFNMPWMMFQRFHGTEIWSCIGSKFSPKVWCFTWQSVTKFN